MTSIMRLAASCLIGAGLLVSAGAEGGDFAGPAPDGDPMQVAQKVIQEQFTMEDCPYIEAALRLGDGSIMIRCGNGEKFRIFTMVGFGVRAWKCSAMKKLLGLDC